MQASELHNIALKLINCCSSVSNIARELYTSYASVSRRDVTVIANTIFDIFANNAPATSCKNDLPYHKQWGAIFSEAKSLPGYEDEIPLEIDELNIFDVDMASFTPERLHKLALNSINRYLGGSAWKSIQASKCTYSPRDKADLDHKVTIRDKVKILQDAIFIALSPKLGPIQKGNSSL